MAAVGATAVVAAAATGRRLLHEPGHLMLRIGEALSVAADVLATFDRQTITEQQKAGGDPVTEADIAIDHVLRRCLLADGEGWLSEESSDDTDRIDKPLVWIVDPLDGTREFIDGLAEFCISVAAVADGVPVAGGIVNVAAGIEVTGATGIGVFCNGRPVEPLPCPSLDEVPVLASRTEVQRGQWAVVESEAVAVRPMGSVAYKLGRVAAGLDHLTWTPVPKHEWDVAGGAALIPAAGGSTLGIDGNSLVFNQERPWIRSLVDLQLKASE